MKSLAAIPYVDVPLMSYWEEREKSWAYYLCTALIVGYLSIGLFFGAVSTGLGWIPLEAFLGGVLYTAVVLVFYFGLGVRYRRRVINPDNRTVMTIADPLYFDPADIEKRP
ncbi:MAG: hypothetical protein ACFFCK_00790 [Promethearchaeota archaeon]